MQKIKEVGIISLARIVGVVYASFGFVVGVLVVLSRLFNIDASGEAAQLQAVGYWSVFLFPVIYGLIGALTGLATGFFFNKAAGWVGPLEVKIVQSQE